ncbi:PilZ domain-containing protein [Candidatus Omnitrophota bacterium]
MKILSRLFKARGEEIESPISERRGAKRHEVLLALDYRDPLSECHGEALTKNISRDGLRFPVKTKIPKGTILDLKIEDPNRNASIHSKAKVVWLQEFISGDDAGDVVYEVGAKLLRKRIY